jgi:hypothetical protein
MVLDLAFIAVAVLVGIVYHTLTEGLFSASLGKMLFGIEVRRFSGERSTFADALRRNILRLIDSLGLYLIAAMAYIFGKHHQTLGDRWAGTVVVVHHGGLVKRVVAGAVLACVATVGLVSFCVNARIFNPPLHALRVAAESNSPTSSARLMLGNISLLDKNSGKPVITASQPFDLHFEVAGSHRGADNTVDWSVAGSIYDPANTLVYTFNDQAKASVPLPLRPTDDRQGMQLPDYSPGGNYRLNLSVHDLHSAADVKTSIIFPVVGSYAACAEPQIADIALAASPDGPWLNEQTIHPGDTVYFHVTVCGLGFHAGSTDAFLDLREVTEAGVVITHELGTQSMKFNASYAPSTWHDDGIYTVKMKAAARPGVYQMQFTLRDTITGKSSSKTVSFRLD